LAHRELSADAGYINAGREIHSPLRVTLSSIHPLSCSSFFYPRIFALASLPCYPRAPPFSSPDSTCKSHGCVLPCRAHTRIHTRSLSLSLSTLYFLARISRGRKARLYFYVVFNRGFTRIFETISCVVYVSITPARSCAEDRLHRSLHIWCTLPISIRCDN